MRLNKALGIAIFLIYVIFIMFGDELKGMTRILTHLGFWALIAWHFIWGVNIKGWVGKPYAELKKECDYLTELTKEWEYPDGTIVPQEKRRGIMDRQEKLWSMMKAHPDSPHSADYRDY